MQAKKSARDPFQDPGRIFIYMILFHKELLQICLSGIFTNGDEFCSGQSCKHCDIISGQCSRYNRVMSAACVAPCCGTDLEIRFVAVHDSCYRKVRHRFRLFYQLNVCADQAEMIAHIYDMATQSPYYIGAVHENEPENGEKLVQILLDKGDRNIGLIGWEQGDATWLGRWEGYKAGVENWNKEHPDDQAKLSEPQYAGTSSEGGSKAAEALMSADPTLDALIPAGGGGDPLQGAIAAVERAGKVQDIDIVSTDFLPDLGERLENGSMAGQSGGHYCDPLIAFMMVYNAIKGNYSGFEGKFEDVPFPYLYVSSTDDYKAYEQYFVDQLPYTDEELVEMSELDLEGLKEAASKISIEDAAARAGK